MSDVVGRAKAALEGVRRGPWQVVGYGNITAPACGNIRVGKVIPAVDAAFVAEARSLVPELVAEIDRLREHLRCCTDELFKSGAEVARLRDAL